MRDQDLTLDFLSLCLMGVAVCWALIRKRIDPRLGWAALAMAVFSWILPRHISGGDYVDYRMETSAVLVGALAISVLPGEGTMARVLTLLAPVPFLLRLAVTTITWQADSDLTARLLTALDHVPEGAKVASAVVTNGDRWPLNHLEHVGDYAVIRRHAWTNANFAVEHIHMLKMREGGFVDPSQRIVQKASAPVLLADFAPASGADFLWYVGAKAPASLPAGASVVWRDGPNLLVRLAKPGEPH